MRAGETSSARAISRSRLNRLNANKASSLCSPFWAARRKAAIISAISFAKAFYAKARRKSLCNQSEQPKEAHDEKYCFTHSLNKIIAYKISANLYQNLPANQDKTFNLLVKQKLFKQIIKVIVNRWRQ